MKDSVVLGLAFYPTNLLSLCLGPHLEATWGLLITNLNRKWLNLLVANTQELFELHNSLYYVIFAHGKDVKWTFFTCIYLCGNKYRLPVN